MIAHKQEAIDARLESVKRSLHTITDTTIYSTRWRANSQLRNAQRWLKQRGIAYYYDGKTSTFRVQEDARTTPESRTHEVQKHI